MIINIMMMSSIILMMAIPITITIKIKFIPHVMKITMLLIMLKNLL